MKKQWWDSGDLAEAVGPGVVMTAIDHVDGMHPDHDANMLEECFQDLPEMSPLTSVTMPGTSYSKLDDDSWGINLAKKPRRATATIQWTTGNAPSSGIYLSLLKDARQPDAKYALSGLRIKQGEKELPIQAASSNLAMDRLLLAFDGSGGYHHFISQQGKDMHVFMMTENPIPPKTTLTVEVDFKGKPWCQIGTRLALRELSASSRRAQKLMAETKRIYGVYKILSENKGLAASTKNYPALLVMDAQGRFIAMKDGLRKGDSVDELAAFVRTAREKRIARDRVWELARQKTGGERAQLLVQGLEAIGCQAYATKGNWRSYAPVFEEIKKMELPANHAVSTKYFYDLKLVDSEIKALLSKGNEARALAVIDFELTKSLSASMRETLLVRKYGICQKSKNENVSRLQWDVLNQLVKEFPQTRRGIGARGLLAWKAGVGPVSFTYGWQGRHLQDGETIWKIDLDTAKAFYTAEPYDIEFKLGKGAKHGLLISSVKIYDQEHLVASLEPNQSLDKDSPSYTGRVDLTSWKTKHPDAQLVVVCKVSPVGGTESSGTIKAIPCLPPPPVDNW
ncbi:hypothetical protein HW115_17110 [Verrucomicrobiaceae bacterium N1E253]|uniref:Uncharacterized protein n=2 Tax=Oceaniferula marina TaxID=2748318 RepID=A0A851GIK9_9BACT|nr:hypothetical protein [Oceaniferula marina]